MASVSHSRVFGFNDDWMLEPLTTRRSAPSTGNAAAATLTVDAPIPATSAGVRKTTGAVVRDGSPSAAVQPPSPEALITTDTVPGDRTTTATLTVNGVAVTSTIDTIGDQDFYAVELVAGHTYAFSMSMVTGGPSLIPLSDSYLELYSREGTLLVAADGGADPQGLDAVLSFTARDTGTYYINARAFDQDPTNGTTGDAIGDYRLSVTEVTSDPTAYVPFYSPDSPLHSLDWGSQFSRTSRNPDGDNGTRSDNGVANGGAPIANNPYGIVGKNVITYYYAEAGDIFISEDPTTVGTTDNLMVAQGMQQWEIDAFEKCWDIYESVADIVYVRVYDRAQADIKIITYEGTPGVGASLLGRMSPPGENNAGQMEINTGDVRWTEEGVSQGGFYFPTLLHELAHGHGMAHPHDNGGRSSVMRGAEPSDDPVEGAIGGQYGDFGLSQQVYTVMSYNDGWYEGEGPGFAPEGHGRPRSGGITGTEVDHFGWVGTLSALDIAVLQDKYGVNEEHATGDNVYVIKDVNAAGTYYSTIWDGGGDDEIRYSGSRDATIDLRAATLQYEEGGGGRMSFALGAWSGFTIANGVTIERATGGEGHDRITGNAAANILIGNGGNDALDGGAGIDRLYGGTGNDSYFVDAQGDLVFENVGEGHDTVTTTSNFYLYAHIEDLTLAAGAGAIFGAGNGQDNLITGNESDNLLVAVNGNDTVHGGAGNDSIYGGNGDDILNGDAGIDYIVGGDGTDTLNGGADADALYGEEGADILVGGDGFFTDILVGGSGNDILRGDTGLGDYDRMDGGADDDIYYVDTGDDLTFEAVGGGIDTVYADVRTSNGGVYLYANVENLVLMGTTAFGVGNELNNALTGNASGNWLLGGAGDDAINGGAGNDVLFGEAGRDTFVFGRGTGGDVIGDFNIAEDRIDVSAFGFTSFAEIQTRFSQVNANGAINLAEGDFIVLHNTTMANLTAANFIFASAGTSAEPVDKSEAQVVPGAADQGPSKDGGPLVLPGLDDGLIDDFLLGKTEVEVGPQILPGAADDIMLTAKAEILPGGMDLGLDDAFLVGKADIELGPQILPGADGDVGFEPFDAFDMNPGLDHRLSLLLSASDKHMAGLDGGYDPVPMDSLTDLWAA